MVYENWSDWVPENGDFIMNTKNVDYRMPLLYDPKYILNYLDRVEDPSDKIIYAILIRYSGLFELGQYRHANVGEIYLKEKYNDEVISNILQEVRNNFYNIKAKDIAPLCEQQNIDVTKLLNSLTVDLKREQLFRYIHQLITMEKINFNDPEIEEYILRTYYILNGELTKNIGDEILIQRYYSLNKVFNSNPNIFVRLDNKKLIKKEDIKKLLDIVKKELIVRIGITKLEYISNELDKLNTTKDRELLSKVRELLIVKKSINTEIDEVRRQIKVVKKEDKTYNQLLQRLNKLEFYKENFNTEEIMSADGIFNGYYGFDFDGVLVLDYFIDSEKEMDIETKARKESGNAVYILSYEDYLYVKNLPNKREARAYIRKELKLAGDFKKHTINFSSNILEAVKIVKEQILIRKGIKQLLEVDNPVTEEEIVLTKEQIDKYALLYLDKENPEELLEIFEKTNNNKLKKILGKKIKSHVIDKKITSKKSKDKLTEEEIELEEYVISEDQKYLEDINTERRKNKQKELSYKDSKFSDVVEAIEEYKEKHRIVTIQTARDEHVAKATKDRTIEYIDNIPVYTCECCGDKKLYPFLVESHHFIPISEGGPDMIYNTVCLCLECHKAIHRGLLTDNQKYQLINKIKQHIYINNPEYINRFEETLGYIDNFYQSKYDEIGLSIEELYDSEVTDETIKKIEELEEEQQKIYSKLIRHKASYERK